MALETVTSKNFITLAVGVVVLKPRYKNYFGLCRNVGARTWNTQASHQTHLIFFIIKRSGTETR